MLKKLLGLAPTKVADNRYQPSPVALKLATSPTTDYQEMQFSDRYQGDKKVLMLCTEEQYMTMKNGRQFVTGNHPVEMLVPMLHLQNAGFAIDVFTPTGQSAKIEHWALPEKDTAVMALYHEYEDKFAHPMSLQEFVNHDMANCDDYAAVLIPGGHGAMLGLPDNEDVQKLIAWVAQKDIYMLSICHGPAALLAADNSGRKKDFVYKGYKMAVFPDSVDKQTPMIGYMPGHMPWQFGKRLKKLGVKIVNKKADDTCYQDRKLITAASPKAANEFGVMAAKALLKQMQK